MLYIQPPRMAIMAASWRLDAGNHLVDAMLNRRRRDSHDGRAFGLPNILDEYSRECLVVRVTRKLNSIDVIDALTDLFIVYGVPSYIRSDNGPECAAEAVRKRIAAVGAKTASIQPGSPWKNGDIESFNARLWDGLLNAKIFYSLREAQIIVENWRRHCNTKRPHASLGYRPSTPENVIALHRAMAMHQHQYRTKQFSLVRVSL